MALSDEDHRTLSKGAGGRQTPVRLAQRARIALLATDGTMNKGIAVEVGTALKTVKASLETAPPEATHWSTRTLAEHLGVSRSMAHRVCQANQLKPHLVSTFKLSNEPHFIAKLVDVVGLYLDPPDHALVLNVDAKRQIQALERTPPRLPRKPGRCGTMPHDYQRNGPTTLSAALNVADGGLITTCAPRHRHQEIIKQVARARTVLDKVSTD